ncbi:MAG: GTPase HflX [Mariprofundaceae bacterium]|nr:GTPase HflX [Mariprofundaceae bacterium]
MSELISTERVKDRALSVHPQIENRREYVSISRQEEFNRLALSSDCDLRDSISIPVRRMTASTLLGSGQVALVGEQVAIHEAGVVFVDHQLTPVQQRNLEKAWDCKVVDRTGLILEIFAARARTREGVLQVELASLNYQISRLVRSWTHLERQRGGFGFMGGPGERQIELDRRMIRTRIKSLEKDLAHVRRMRATQRSGRQRKEIATVALVGYTNAGKSTLFNHLTEGDVYVADQLFATLDPTLRLLKLPGGSRVMLSDTVGFVQDLPHELVDAFKSTLEEVVEADLILHVRDASDPGSADQKIVVEETLAQLGLDGDDAPPVIELLNKIDLVPQTRSKITKEIAGSRVAISALTGEGTDLLLKLLSDWCEQDSQEFSLQVPLSDGKTLAYCHAHGRVLEQKVEGDQLMLKVRMASRHASKVRTDAV